MQSSISPASARRSNFQGFPRHNKLETQMLVSITMRTAYLVRRCRRTSWTISLISSKDNGSPSGA